MAGRAATRGQACHFSRTDRVLASVSANYSAGLDIAQWITNQDPDGDGVARSRLRHARPRRRRHDVPDTYAFNRDLTAADVSAAVRRGRRLRRHPPTRAAACRSSSSRSRSPTIRTSTPSRCAETSCCAGSTCRGSTLFVVWDLSQADYSRPGQFSLFRDLGKTFGGNSTNVLMVKATYWFNR